MITGIDHIQLTVARAEEAAAKAFYCDLLGLTEAGKPDSLAGRGGFWLQVGDRQVHVGVEDGVKRSATKAHIAYAVCDLALWRRRLQGEGIELLECEPIPGHERFEFRDPFGNRVELIEPRSPEALPRPSAASHSPETVVDADEPAALGQESAAEVRRFRRADEPEVIALWESVFGYTAPHNDPATAIHQKLRVGPDLFLVAIREGAVVGTVMGGYDGHRGWIYSLGVRPDHRRQRIATALVRSVECALAERGCLKVNLQVLASNEETVAFYQKLGYAVEERVSMGKLL